MPLILDDSSAFALFDDNLDRSGDLLLGGLACTIICNGLNDLGGASARIEAARARGCWVAVAACYELGYLLEPRLAPLLPAGVGPLLTAWVFRQAQRLSATATGEAIERALAALPDEQRVAGVAGIERAIDGAAYRSSVERIRDWIAAGDCYQVNFTFPLSGEAYGDPLALYQLLRETQPVRHGTFIRHRGGAILSRSPELFVERRGRKLTCRPMKGTAPRSSDPAELSKSEKDRAENVMIVDLIRNDLARLAPAGGVRVTRLFDVEPYETVWQMTSTVIGAPIDASLERIFRALFPCGSITGAPKIRSMQIIRELEAQPRGIYCGALGWISPTGDFRFSVPIRTLEIDADRKARMGIGSGIVADSIPDREWEECLLKARFLTDLPPRFALIETLLCDPVASPPYPLLDLHLERISRSAAHFGFRLDRAALAAELGRTAKMLTGRHRVRVCLEASGRFELTSAPLEALPADVRQSVVTAPERISSRDPLRRHKTTVRAAYDRVLAEVIRAGHFDALFLNERDELAEGARTNLFLDMGDGCLLTPPLESGALDGVYRRKLINEGRARERKLYLRDLRSAKTVYLANALRGLIPVRLVEETGTEKWPPEWQST